MSSFSFFRGEKFIQGFANKIGHVDIICLQPLTSAWSLVAETQKGMPCAAMCRKQVLPQHMIHPTTMTAIFLQGSRRSKTQYIQYSSVYFHHKPPTSKTNIFWLFLTPPKHTRLYLYPIKICCSSPPSPTRKPLEIHFCYLSWILSPTDLCAKCGATMNNKQIHYGGIKISHQITPSILLKFTELSKNNVG